MTPEQAELREMAADFELAQARANTVELGKSETVRGVTWWGSYSVTSP
jgi:hypothetical protein